MTSAARHTAGRAHRRGSPTTTISRSMPSIRPSICPGNGTGGARGRPPRTCPCAGRDRWDCTGGHNAAQGASLLQQILDKKSRWEYCPLIYLCNFSLNTNRLARATERTAIHALTGMGVGDGSGVPVGGVVPGRVTRGVEGTGVGGVTGGRGMVAGVVPGTGVAVVWVVIGDNVVGCVVTIAVGIGGLVVPVEMVVPPTEKLDDIGIRRLLVKRARIMPLRLDAVGPGTEVLEGNRPGPSRVIGVELLRAHVHPREVHPVDRSGAAHHRES